MLNRTKISLFAGAAVLALTMATPASAAPGGSYQQTCRDISQRHGQALTATCQTRDGSWVETRLDNADCSGDIANVNGRLVCNDNGNNSDDRSVHNERMRGDGDRRADTNNDDGDDDRRADRGDGHSQGDTYAENPPYGQSYGDRRDDDRGYADDDILPRGQLVRRMERQGYLSAHDLRPIHSGDDWRAMASWHGRDVVVRLNPHNGRVLSARFVHAL